MSFEPNEETREFRNQVQAALEEGYVKNYNELAKALGWQSSNLSAVMKGKRNVPKHISILFRKYIEDIQRGHNSDLEILVDEPIENGIRRSALNLAKINSGVILSTALFKEIKDLSQNDPKIQFAADMGLRKLETVLKDITEELDLMLYLAKEFEHRYVSLHWRWESIWNDTEIIGYRNAKTGEELSLEQYKKLWVPGSGEIQKATKEDTPE